MEPGNVYNLAQDPMSGYTIMSTLDSPVLPTLTRLPGLLWVDKVFATRGANSLSLSFQARQAQMPHVTPKRWLSASQMLIGNGNPCIEYLADPQWDLPGKRPLVSSFTFPRLTSPTRSDLVKMNGNSSNVPCCAVVQLYMYVFARVSPHGSMMVQMFGR